MRIVLAILVALFIVAWPVNAQSATARDTADITWSVRPASSTGPDGRSWAELTLDPGEEATDHLAVRNFSDTEVTFAISAADGLFTDTGRFDMLAPGEPSTAAGTWLTVPSSVTVAPSQTAIVPFVVRVPPDAEPGDHAAGVAVSIQSEVVDDSGTRLGLESRVGFRVMTRVTGSFEAAAEVSAVDPDYQLSWNPFNPGRARIAFAVTNTGNTRLLVRGDVSLAGVTTDFPGEAEPDQELLPGDSRTFSVAVDDVWPLFLVAGEVSVAPDVVTVDGTRVVATPIVESFGVIAIPWPQLAVLGGVLLVGVAVAGGRIRSRRRVDELLELAREEGRRDALESTDRRATV
jgi:hypothetical protein